MTWRLFNTWYVFLLLFGRIVVKHTCGKLVTVKKYAAFSVVSFTSVCVCVCVCERERERERETWHNFFVVVICSLQFCFWRIEWVENDVKMLMVKKGFTKICYCSITVPLWNCVSWIGQQVLPMSGITVFLLYIPSPTIESVCVCVRNVPSGLLELSWSPH